MMLKSFTTIWKKPTKLDLLVQRKFLKDLAKIPTRDRAKIESFVFESLPGYATIEEIGKLEKMQGYRDYYKVRFGDYRIGIFYEAQTLVLERVLHHREIYRFFP